jgi:hypothetical protein
MTWLQFFFLTWALVLALLVGMRLGLWMALRRMDQEAFEAEARCAQVRLEAEAVVRQVCADAEAVVREERAAVDEQRRQCLAILEDARAVNNEVLGKVQLPVIRPQGGARWGTN